MNPRHNLLHISGMVLMAFSPLMAQTPRVELPAASPTATLKQRVGLTDVEIVYSRPGAKNRKIFGGLVPFGEVWRTGANGSTKISFSTPVKLGGTDIPAGKYALYTIPGEKEWTIIIYKDTTLNGAFKYDAKDDLVRIKVQPTEFAAATETFTIEFGDIRDDSATLQLIWDKTLVGVKLETDYIKSLVTQVETAVGNVDVAQAQFYFQMGTFYLEHGSDPKKVLSWVDTGLATHPKNSYMLLYLKAKVLAKQGDKAGATAAAKESSESAVKNDGPTSGFVKMNQDLVSSLH